MTGWSLGPWRRRAAPLALTWLAFVTPPLFAEEVIVEPVVSTLQCLQSPSRAALDQSGEVTKVGEGGVLRLRLSFLDPDAPPKVDVFFDTVGSDVRERVLAYVAAYRLPCMDPAKGKVIAIQEFAFRQSDARQVVSGIVRDVPNPLPTDCFKPVARALSYPRLKSNPFGPITTRAVVLARMTFEAKGAPPRVDIVFNSGSKEFEDAVRDTVADYRYTCELPSTRGVRAEQQFNFQMDGDAEVALKDSTLSGFTGALAKLDEQKVRFDFTTMNCPFSVSLSYRRPYADNAVREIGRSDPNRREFLEWLKRVEFNGSRDNLRLIVGKSMRIAVPCGSMDLT